MFVFGGISTRTLRELSNSHLGRRTHHRFPRPCTTDGRDGRPPAGEPHPCTICQPNPGHTCPPFANPPHMPAIRKSAVLTRANRPVAVLVPCCVSSRPCLPCCLSSPRWFRVPCSTGWFRAAATTAARHTQGGEPLKVHRRYRRHPGHQARGPVRGDND